MRRKQAFSYAAVRSSGHHLWLKLCVLTALCCWCASMQAQNWDRSAASVIAVEAEGGQKDAHDAGIYTIDCGTYTAGKSTTFNLKLGQAVGYPVSVELRFAGLNAYDAMPTIYVDDTEAECENGNLLITFAPGETEKKLSFTLDCDLEMLQVTGRKPIYFELLFPSRATLDTRLVELVYDFNAPPSGDYEFADTYNSIRGNYYQPLFTQDGYGFLHMTPQNDETSAEAYVRANAETRFTFTLGNVDFNTLSEEFPTTLPSATHDVGFVPRQQGNNKSSAFTTVHRFSQNECIRDKREYSNSPGGDSRAFVLMSAVASAGPFFSAASTDDTAPTTLSAEDLTAYEGENNKFELLHAVPYINNVTTTQTAYAAGQQMDVTFTITNWRFYYHYYRETMLQQLFVTFDHGQTQVPLTGATMSNGTVTASVKVPAAAGDYTMEIGVRVNNTSRIATTAYYPATAFKAVTITADEPAFTAISQMTIAGVPDVIRHTSEDICHNYQAYAAITPATATCQGGTWSIARNDGEADDVLAIDSEGRLTLKVEDGWDYQFAKAGKVTITFVSSEYKYRVDKGENPDVAQFTLTKEVTLLPDLPTPKTFYIADERQDVYGDTRAITLDYQFNTDETWHLANSGTVTLTVTAKDNTTRQLVLDAADLKSERKDNVLHVYVPMTVSDHEYSFLERHGRTSKLVWTLKTDVTLPFTNSISDETYETSSYRYVNYAYDPVYTDEWPYAASPLQRDAIRGKADKVVARVYNLAKNYFYVNWTVRSDENWDGSTPATGGGYNYTNKQSASWSTTDGTPQPDWLRLSDRGDYYDATIEVPIATDDFEGDMVPVEVYVGASCEPGEYHYFKPVSYIHYTVFDKDDLHFYVQRRYSETENDVTDVADGQDLNLSDESDVNAYNTFLATYTTDKDLFAQIVKRRKGNILALSPRFEGSAAYAGTWEARKTKVTISGGLLGDRTISKTCGDGMFVYFPMADATYKIDITNETFNSTRTIHYTTHALNESADIYGFKGCNYYYLYDNTESGGYWGTSDIQLAYATEGGQTNTVDAQGGQVTWFYEPEKIIGYNAFGYDGNPIYDSKGFVHGFAETIKQPLFTAAFMKAESGQAAPAFSEMTCDILGMIEKDDYVSFTTQFDNDGQLHLSLHNLEGLPVTGARVNYVAVDAEGQPSGKGKGQITSSADGKAVLPFSTIITDQEQESLFLEVVADGYEPKFYKYNLEEQSYRNSFNAAPSNEVDLVLETADESTTLLSRADLRTIVEADADTTAVTFGITDMTAFNLVERVGYKEEGPLGGPKTIHTLKAENGVYKYAKRWEGEKFAQLDLTFQKKANLNYSQMRLTGFGNIKDITPTAWRLIEASEATGFEHDYIDATFNLVGFVPNEKMAIPLLKVGDTDLAQLPKLHNEEIDMDSIARNTHISVMTNPDFNPSDIGTQSKQHDCDLGEDNQELFDKIDFDFPDVMGFQFQVKKVGNHFLVRGVYSKNFIPGGNEVESMQSTMDELKDYANQFDKVFKDCVDACSGVDNDDEFDFLYDNDPLFASNDAFVGIRAFISGVAYVGPNGDFKVNFHDGGIKLEISGEYTHKCSFGIGSFGAKLSGELSTQLKMINHNAAAGDVSNFSLNVMVETEVRAEIVAWATAGLNILNLVKAEVGVRGGVSASYKAGISYPLVNNPSASSVYAGHQMTLRSGMFIYADARFLWFKKHWEKWFFKFSKQFNWPDDSSNPYSDDFVYGPSIFTSRTMGGNTWKKVKRRRTVGLGETLMNDVTDMASPRLFNHGSSLIYNDLNTASDYNDDRLMMRPLGSSSSQDIHPDALGAAFAFDVAERGDYGAVAFEQFGNSNLSKTEVEAGSSMDDINQMSRQVDVMASVWNGSSWTNTKVSTVDSLAHLSPRVAVQDDGHAAVVWLSGTPMATAADKEEDRQQYLVGSYMLSRYDGMAWSQPIELAKLSQSFVISDHRMVMAGDSLFIVMEHQDDLTSKENPFIDYICVSPANTVTRIFGTERGRNPQVVRMGDVNMVGYLTERPDSTQDIRLRTVNMGNVNVATTDSYARLGRRSVNAFKLTATENAASLDDLAIIWSQSVMNPETSQAESWLCAGRFGKSGSNLFVSYPEEVVRIPDDFTATAFDGYMDDNNLQVVYALSDVGNDGTAVIRKAVTFTNSIKVNDCVITAANAASKDEIPFKLNVQNTGYAPITAVTAEIGASQVDFTDMTLLPGETAELTGYFAINTANYDGQEQMSVSAQFGGMNTALARRMAMSTTKTVPMPSLMRRTVSSRNRSVAAARRAATDPSLSASATINCTVQATDLSCSVIANRIRGKSNSVIAKVTNCSQLPLLATQTVTAGLYASAADTEPLSGTQTVSIPVSSLYADGAPLSTIIRLQADNLEADQEAFIKVTVSDQQEAVVTDVRPENNHVPVTLYADEGNRLTTLLTIEDASKQNSPAIAQNDALWCNTVLNNRTLYKDGKWNTICLPFNLTLSGSPLEGAEARTVSEASISGETLNLTFGPKVTQLAAGVPYIIKWTKAADYVDDQAHDLVNPVFVGIKVDAADHSYTNSEQSVSFKGCYDARTFTAEARNSILLMGADNTLHYAGEGAGLGACRAYFLIDMEQAAIPADTRLSDFNIDFGDGSVTTGIIAPATTAGEQGDHRWYAIDGRQLGAKPSAKGVYISTQAAGNRHAGKVIVK